MERPNVIDTVPLSNLDNNNQQKDPIIDSDLFLVFFFLSISQVDRSKFFLDSAVGGVAKHEKTIKLPTWGGESANPIGSRSSHIFPHSHRIHVWYIWYIC